MRSRHGTLGTLLVLAAMLIAVAPYRLSPRVRAAQLRMQLQASGSAESVGEIDCVHFDECGGCAIASDLLDVNAAIEARTFCESHLSMGPHAAQASGGGGGGDESGGAAVDGFKVVLGDATGWRTLAKLAVADGGARGGIQLGLYAARSRTVVPIPQCVVHHPSINAAQRALLSSCRRCGIRAFDEKTGRGELRYVTIMVERRTGAVAVGLIFASTAIREVAPRARLVAKALREALGQEDVALHSVWAHLRGNGGGNAIFSPRPDAWHCIVGAKTVAESFEEDLRRLVDSGAIADGDIRQRVLDPATKLPLLHYSPAGFRQANMDAFAGVVAAVAAHVPRGAAVAELFGGCGTLGLSVEALRGPLRFLRCSDENEASAEGFAKTARFMDGGERGGAQGTKFGMWQSRLSFEAFSAFDAVINDAARDAEVLLVDPPRSGLGPDLLALLCENSRGAAPIGMRAGAKLVYVSCGLDSFKRDALQLLASRRWRMEAAEGHLLFPGSNHVETVAVFQHLSGSARGGGGGGGGGGAGADAGAGAGASGGAGAGTRAGPAAGRPQRKGKPKNKFMSRRRRKDP